MKITKCNPGRFVFIFLIIILTFNFHLRLSYKWRLLQWFNGTFHLKIGACPRPFTRVTFNPLCSVLRNILSVSYPRKCFILSIFTIVSEVETAIKNPIFKKKIMVLLAFIRVPLWIVHMYISVRNSKIKYVYGYIEICKYR